jgi:hypothetical protein
MARSIVVRLGDEESAFGFTKVEREKLYGKKERVVVDELGRECQAAWLTPDGAVLVPTGGTAHVWLDEKWDAREQSDRVAVDATNTPLSVIPSTLGVPKDLKEIDERRVLDLVTTNVYELAPETLGPTLAAALQAGRLFETEFTYRDGFEEDSLVLLGNEDGFFALVGRPSGFGFVSREVVSTDAAEGPDDLDSDLDFGML